MSHALRILLLCLVFCVLTAQLAFSYLGVMLDLVEAMLILFVVMCNMQKTYPSSFESYLGSCSPQL